MPKHADLIAAHGTAYPYDPGANTTEDLEPRITRGAMIEWLQLVRRDRRAGDPEMIDAIIAHLKAH